MDKRAFLRLSSAPALSPFVRAAAAGGQTSPPTNWAGNVRYGTQAVDQPATLEEIRRVVRQNDRLKVLGTRHCFNRIADSTDRLVALTRMNQVVALDPERR